MDANDIFEEYYTLYRAETPVPASTDDEYALFLVLSREAINYWQHYDNTYWKELFTTLQLTGTGGTKTITTGTATYAAPTDMQEAGGFVRVQDTNGTLLQKYPILEPQDVQFRADTSTYCWFSGNPQGGYTLYLNPAPPSSLNGKAINYVYYKKATLLTGGTIKPEMSNPYFIAHRALANRFRASRNPYTQTAKSDAENAMRIMQLKNNSGNWADPWKVADNSGSSWGT